MTHMSRGELIGALAIPESESDAFNMQARADRVGGQFSLNGRKCFASLLQVAHLALVFPLTDRGAGKWGVSTYINEAFSVTVPQEDLTIEKSLIIERLHNYLPRRVDGGNPVPGNG